MTGEERAQAELEKWVREIDLLIADATARAPAEVGQTAGEAKPKREAPQSGADAEMTLLR
jgi:hypothetical protein